MKIKIFRTLMVFSLSILVFAVSVMAQGIGSVEYEMKYGREYFEARKYDMAITYFENAVKKDSDHAEANYLIGVCHVKLGKPEKARPFLEKAARLDAGYRAEIEKFFAKADGATEKENETPKKRTSTDAQTGQEIAEYEVGDTVEVSYAGEWNPGKIVKVEGRGESVRAEVDYTFQGDKRTAKFSYNALRHAAVSSNSKGKPAETSGGGTLAYGDYVCTEGLAATGLTQKGYIRLNPNGTYRYLDGGSTGRYKYNAETGEITWSSGYFTQGNRTTTKYKPGKRVSQIDITFHTKNGELYWSCGHNR